MEEFRKAQAEIEKKNDAQAVSKKSSKWCILLRRRDTPGLLGRFSMEKTGVMIRFIKGTYDLLYIINMNWSIRFMNVYEYKIDKNIEYKKSESTIKLPITDSSRDRMIEAFASYKGVNYFNNKVVRLEKIENNDNKIQLTLSLIDFFDFLVINIISAQLEDFVQYLRAMNVYYTLCDEIESIKQYRDDMLGVKDFTTLIANGYSSNALAISALLTDEKGDYLLTQRGLKTGISEMMHSVTATGAIEEEDYHSMDAIRNCVVRELREELNLCVDKKDLNISSIVAGKKKLQPIVIVNGRVKGSFSKLLKNVNDAVDFEYEVHKLIISDREELETIVQNENFTEAIEYHLKIVILEGV